MDDFIDKIKNAMHGDKVDESLPWEERKRLIREKYGIKPGSRKSSESLKYNNPDVISALVEYSKSEKKLSDYKLLDFVKSKSEAKKLTRSGMRNIASLNNINLDKGRR